MLDIWQQHTYAELFLKDADANLVTVTRVRVTTRNTMAPCEADPFVIATAETRGLTVITEETGPDSSKKIPGVCRTLRTPVLNLMELIDGEDWVIG